MLGRAEPEVLGRAQGEVLGRAHQGPSAREEAGMLHHQPEAVQAGG
jgi:hypothetical protein